MTYSHQIDPAKEWCANEALGDPCNDANCPFQHYRDMEISGASPAAALIPRVSGTPFTQTDMNTLYRREAFGSARHRKSRKDV